MKKLTVLAAIAVGGAASAQVPIGPFNTWMIENFDSFTPSVWTTVPTMSGWSNCSMFNGFGALVIGNPLSGFLNPPNSMFGDLVDANWQFVINIKRFGGFFKIVNGNGITGMRMKFYTVSNTLWYTTPALWYTTPVLPINNSSFTWHGYWLFAPIRRVEVMGFPNSGFVSMDEVRARP